MSTPGLLSPSATSCSSDRFLPACFLAIQRSTNQRTTPPIRIGDDDDSGRYTPTAKASDGIPDISSTMAIIAPRITSAHGSFPPRMPLMMYDISVAFGASNLVSFTPARLVLYVPLMAGSTKYTGRPVSSTRYFSALPPEGSWRCHTKYDLVSPFACDAGMLSWL